ncbi:hypothetical protein PF005_g23107 [Phytophthora fragariae]|uniref:Uncharacterized protein n=1 Tax=Phytophthora fragariae TaxID=53985 RepID=A0A6A3WDK6_9STRA|nr:hypothetical protein PF009_g23851 [Phytophthora fragariae]KAE8984458.1 hypothetical protein PF011_g20775 [Phytophthora fragariae]KAE9080665.1 hypothetical protein PF010_g22297 [Phytophthora fragariae]KAE9081189.1 hypothetical protein PF007_g22769 [Phytophthora fragariae]KAE9102631.1 hypothetical protein PF006_g22378 [Phytophthora fragariae]
MEAVAAVEDAFLRGEWTQVLNDSRSILAARIVQVQLRQESENPDDSAVITAEEERVLSVYLQAVFELDLDDEVESATTIAQAFAPLPSGIAIQWSKFLVAMNRRPMATQVLRDLLESYAVDAGGDFTSERYATAVEVLVLQLLLPDEGIEVARQFVTGDSVLDDGAKLQLLRRIQAAHLAAQETGKVAEQSSVNGLQQHGEEQGDDSSCYVMIGGTAIALAVAAAGALRYREKIHECVSNAIPAISKGLVDAKYALFEA